MHKELIGIISELRNKYHIHITQQADKILFIWVFEKNSIVIANLSLKNGSNGAIWLSKVFKKHRQHKIIYERIQTIAKYESEEN